MNNISVSVSHAGGAISSPSHLPDAPAKVTISTEGDSTRLRNLATDQVVEAAPTETSGQHRAHASQRTEFKIEVPPHSFVALAAE